MSALVTPAKLGVLQTDCGTNFTSRNFKRKIEELGVKHTTSTPYHPESQGQVERFHQTLKSVLKKFCFETGSEWDKELQYALFATRSIQNETIGLSPFKLVFGHNVRGPLDVVREHWEGETPEINRLDPDKASSLVDLINQYKDLFQDAPGLTTILEHDVDVGDTQPIKQCPYR
ncbi:uncharacterized protein LOC135218159 [Macrobrachium nipponense]|uniref:uncharacterized protein LOC135218159 n=1 Tax=Macrobrachium nipponense TaxID=159736 RepID=UPI0030C800C9